MITDDGLIAELPHLLNSGDGGVQRIYRWGSGGLSVVNAPVLHSYPFAWEVAVLEFNGDGYFDFGLTYDTPLSADVEVFASDEETNAFIEKAAAYFLARETKR